jgi:hypothetical protein
MADYDRGSVGMVSSMIGSGVTRYRMTLILKPRCPSGLTDLCESKGKRCTKSDCDPPFLG